jgi:predicted TIM-barrel fold metal-dependent hydrolase
MKIIDPHIHLFNLKDGEYNWLKPQNPPYWPDKPTINKDFIQSDLDTGDGVQLAGFVHIEAGFNNNEPWQEVAWLEQTCSLPIKTIATCDLTLPPELFDEQINRLSEYDSVVGVRHILDDEAAALLAQPNVQINLARIAKANLIFELQLMACDMDSVNMFVQIAEQSELRFTINHAGFPPYEDDNDWQSWLSGLSKLAKYNSAIKCSGWEMLSRDYQFEFQRKVVSACTEIFGIDSVMLASNFPLCLFSKNYDEFWQTSIDIDEKQKQAFVFENARSWYQFTEL